MTVSRAGGPSVLMARMAPPLHALGSIPRALARLVARDQPSRQVAVGGADLTLSGAVGLPLNVMAGRGAGPSIAELQALDVARVSIGPALTLAVMAQIRRAATEVLEQGTYGSMQGGLTFPEANALFSTAGREA